MIYSICAFVGFAYLILPFILKPKIIVKIIFLASGLFLVIYGLFIQSELVWLKVLSILSFIIPYIGVRIFDKNMDGHKNPSA